MGRGLSELQRWILIKAGERAGLSYGEVCRDFYGWEKWKWSCIEGRCFDPKAIGEKEYHRVKSTISRAVKRLALRGLVARCYSMDIRLTEAGAEWLRSRGYPVVEGDYEERRIWRPPTISYEELVRQGREVRGLSGEFARRLTNSTDSQGG